MAGLDVAGASFPAEATGGDYFDYIPMPDGSLAVVIGDVCGHGFGPALVMAELRAYLRASAWPAPTAAIPAAIILAPLVRLLDERTGWRLLGYAPAEAIALLGAIIPAALTMVVLILSMLLLAVQLAASQFPPRLIGGLLARTPVKTCLFIMVFT